MRHECKISVLNYKVQRVDGNNSTIRSKDVLEFHSGFRRFVTQPIFSQHALVLL
jgi:hypothetical protein